MPIQPIDMSDLIAVPPIESLAICALFGAIPTEEEIRPSCAPGNAAGSTAYFDVNGALYPLTAMTAKEYTSLYESMHGQKPADPKVDLEGDSAGRGLRSPTQTMAVRLAEKLAASNPQAPDAVINLLGVRAYAWLVAQVVRRIADSRTEGSFSQALANLGQAGFKTPAGWLSTLFLTHPTYDSQDELVVSISSVALAYQVALHGLMHDEQAGVLVRQTAVPADPLPVPVKVGMTVDQMGGDDVMAVKVPSGGATYDVNLFGSKQLVPLLSASSATVGSVLAKSLQSLSTALAVILAPGYTTEDATTHTCPDGTIWDPKTNACVPKVRLRPTHFINPPTPAPPPAPPPPAPAMRTVIAPPEKGLPWVWIGLGAAALAAGGAGIYAMMRKKDAAAPALPADASKVAVGVTGRAENPAKIGLAPNANLLSNGLVEVALLDNDDDPSDDEPVHVYRFDVPQLKLEKGEARTYLVPVSYDQKTHPHPLPQYEEWFAKDLRKIAKTGGIDYAELVRMLMSKDISERAHAYLDIGNYHGFQNLDSSPTEMTYKAAKKLFKDL